MHKHSHAFSAPSILCFFFILIDLKIYVGWREAIAGDHVRLVLSPDTESSERPEVPSSSSEAAPASDSGEHGVVSRADTELTKNEVLTSSSSGSIKVKYRPKPEKGVKTMYIPKQKNHHLG